MTEEQQRSFEMMRSVAGIIAIVVGFIALVAVAGIARLIQAGCGGTILGWIGGFAAFGLTDQFRDRESLNGDRDDIPYRTEEEMRRLQQAWQP